MHHRQAGLVWSAPWQDTRTKQHPEEKQSTQAMQLMTEASPSKAAVDATEHLHICSKTSIGLGCLHRAIADWQAFQHEQS
jgi:hypothetical protein